MSATATRARTQAKKRRPIWQTVAIAVAVILIIAVVWVDIRTGFWQETVILSGIAAGLLTFVLTATFVEKWLAEREHEKWVPVTRLALADIRHALADEDLSDIGRGHVRARTLRAGEVPSFEDYERLLTEIVEERDRIIAVLARWAPFLASSADVTTLMDHVAEVAEGLDHGRDAIVRAERADGESPEQAHAAVAQQLADYNTAAENAVEELNRILRSLSATA